MLPVFAAKCCLSNFANSEQEISHKLPPIKALEDANTVSRQLLARDMCLNILNRQKGAENPRNVWLALRRPRRTYVQNEVSEFLV